MIGHLARFRDIREFKKLRRRGQRRLKMNLYFIY